MTQDNSGSIGAGQIASSKSRMTERGQSSFTGRFDRRIDPSSLSVLADLGVSEAQIERYRRLWCREDLAAARWEEAIRPTSPRDNNYVATGEIPRHYCRYGFRGGKSRLGPAVPGDG